MIHPKAVIEQGSILGKDVCVGAYAVIEKGVKLADNVRVNPFAHVKGNTEVGENTFIGTGALVGEMPQILGMKENIGRLVIGKNNVFREYVTIHTSSAADKVTRIGDNNYLMGFSHIAHDCHLESNIVVCNGTLLAGHIEVADKAFISGNVAIHQFVRIGKLAMVGGLSRVNQDVPPFMMVLGNSRIFGLNLVGIKRADFSARESKDIRTAFNILYRKKSVLNNALKEIEQIDSDKVREIVSFIRCSKRGICGIKTNGFMEKIFLDYPYFLLMRNRSYNIFLRRRQKSLADNQSFLDSFFK